jgi:hypothetical protein
LPKDLNYPPPEHILDSLEHACPKFRSRFAATVAPIVNPGRVPPLSTNTISHEMKPSGFASSVRQAVNTGKPGRMTQADLSNVKLRAIWSGLKQTDVADGRVLCPSPEF